MTDGSITNAQGGLDFSDEHTALYGDLGGFGMTVSDTDSGYELRLFCDKPFRFEDRIFPEISSLSKILPKNTLIKQSCERDHIYILLDKYRLFQENAVYLEEFLGKLIPLAEELSLSGSAYAFPKSEPRDSADTPEESTRKIKLGFDIRSVFGIIGALIGGAAVTVIAAFAVDPLGEIDTFGLSFEISAYITAAAAAVTVFADYRFLAKKLDACGVLLCPLISLLCVFLSGTGAGVRAAARLEGISFVSALGEFSRLLEKYDDIDKFLAGFLTRGAVLCFFASLALCVLYFQRHPDETIKSEKPDTKTGPLF